MKDKSVVFLYEDSPHPVHEAWAESVDADFQEIHPDWKGFSDPRSFRMRKYDIVFCEGSYSMRLAAFQKALGGKFHLFRLIGSGGYYQVDQKGISLKGEKWATRKVDSAIAVSDWIKQYAEPYFNCEIQVVNPFIDQEKYEKLGELEYTPSTGKILFVGKHWKKEGSRKGLDLIEDAVKILEEKGYDPEVLSIGNRGEKIEYDANIKDLGFVDEETLIQSFQDAELFLQPSRRDSHPVAVLEAIRAGIPPVVSENVGDKYIVEEIDPNLIHELNSESLAEKIEYFLNLSDKEKTSMSKKFRDISENYEKQKKIDQFREKFWNAVN
jgi:glycosyltransferase involved in cell wall biosynthesis